jgi:hypothetical protein
MGIDRIAGRPPGLPPQELGNAPRAEPAAAGFEIARPSSPAPADAVAAPVSALEQVRSGQIDVRTYLDQKVDEATAHLTALPAAQLDAIREALRDRLAGDPSLVDLVRAAAGQSPPPRDD